MPITTRRAALYNARRRRSGHADPMRGLMPTHRFGVTESSVDTDAVWPDRSRPITFATAIRITGASAAGIVFEFGDDTAGVKLAVDSGSLYLAAGDADENEDTGVHGDVAVAALGVTGATLRLVVALRPGTGQARLWVNGTRSLALDAASSTPFLSDAWAADNAGAIGAAHAGSASTLRNSSVVTAPSDFVLTIPFTVAQGQIPRHFG